jgi:hypothetical protein
MLDSATHLSQRPYAIGILEHIPSHIDGELKKPGKETASNDEIIRSMKLKEKQFPSLQRLE